MKRTRITIIICMALSILVISVFQLLTTDAEAGSLRKRRTVASNGPDVFRGKQSAIVGDTGQRAVSRGHSFYNADGSASTVKSRRVSDGSGNGRIKRKTASMDQYGNSTYEKTKAFRGAEGSRGGKSKQITVNADGSVTRDSESSYIGQNGTTVEGKGSFMPDENGSLSGSKTITVTSTDGTVQQHEIGYSPNSGWEKTEQ